MYLVSCPMPLHDQLKLIGLNHSEITVYLFLLENGLSAPPQVSRGTSIARTNCYNILESLLGKGLIQEQTLKKRKAYLACDPESLVRSLEKKKEAIQQILPDLRGLYTTQKNKPKIRFYEGIEQIKELYWQTLTGEYVMALGSTNRIEKLLPGFLDEYFTLVKERGIIFKDILTSDSEAVAREDLSYLRALYDVKLLPKDLKDPPTDILIWKNNVALLTLQEPVFGTIITNPLLSETFELVFNLLWSHQKLFLVELPRSIASNTV